MMPGASALALVAALGCVCFACQGSKQAEPPPRARDDASPCATQPGAMASCTYSLGKTRYCGGVPPSAEVLAQYGKDVCVCNECATDSSCIARPGGRCKSIPPRECDGQPEMRCVYPGDPCFSDTCPGGGGCVLQGQAPTGKATCARPEPPRP